MTRHKILITGIFFAIFIVGLGVIISAKSIGPGELFSSLQELSPRVMSLFALPIIAVFFVLGAYLRRKSEERRWKKALLKVRAKRQN